MFGARVTPSTWIPRKGDVVCVTKDGSRRLVAEVGDASIKLCGGQKLLVSQLSLVVSANCSWVERVQALAQSPDDGWSNPWRRAAEWREDEDGSIGYQYPNSRLAAHSGDIVLFEGEPWVVQRATYPHCSIISPFRHHERNRVYVSELTPIITADNSEPAPRNGHLSRKRAADEEDQLLNWIQQQPDFESLKRDVSTGKFNAERDIFRAHEATRQAHPPPGLEISPPFQAVPLHDSGRAYNRYHGGGFGARSTLPPNASPQVVLFPPHSPPPSRSISVPAAGLAAPAAAGSPSLPLYPCPFCGCSFPASRIDEHASKCLDSQSDRASANIPPAIHRSATSIAPPSAPAVLVHDAFVQFLKEALRKRLCDDIIGIERETDLYPALRAIFASGARELKPYAFRDESNLAGGRNNVYRCDFKDVSNSYHLEVKVFKDIKRHEETRACAQVINYLEKDCSAAVFLLVFDTCPEQGRFFFSKDRWLKLLDERLSNKNLSERVVIILVKPPHLIGE